MKPRAHGASRDRYRVLVEKEYRRCKDELFVHLYASVMYESAPCPPLNRRSAESTHGLTDTDDWDQLHPCRLLHGRTNPAFDLVGLPTDRCPRLVPAVWPPTKALAGGRLPSSDPTMASIWNRDHHPHHPHPASDQAHPSSPSPRSRLFHLYLSHLAYPFHPSFPLKGLSASASSVLHEEAIASLMASHLWPPRLLLRARARARAHVHVRVIPCPPPCPEEDDWRHTSLSPEARSPLHAC